MSDRIVSIMIEFFEGLELLGPADPASTSRAITRVAPAADALIVDVGCGTGRQTLQLLRETPSTVVATDLNQPLLERLRKLAGEQGLTARLRIERADMSALPFEPGSVDVLWSEGSIYNIGFEQGLRAWRPLLRPGGYLCVSDGAYFVDDPPAAVREFWEAEYPAITTSKRLEQIARECGYVLVDSFALPTSAWEAYYGPVERRVDELAGDWAEDAERQQVLVAMRDEIDIFRRHGESYGYLFLVLQKPAA